MDRTTARDEDTLATYRACGKAIMFGEHFVVHGCPALAIPITTVATEVSVIARLPDTPVALDAPVPSGEAAQADRLLMAALERLGLTGLGWQVAVSSSIPIGQGLGSSAAFSTALVGALAGAARHSLSSEELNQHAHALEGVVHGRPSGIDDTVVTHQRPVWFVPDRPVRLLDYPASLELVLASSGEVGSTRLAVEKVARLAEAEPDRFGELCARAQRAAREGLEAFESCELDRLGGLMDRSHELLQLIGVATPGIDQLVDAARQAGALGAKLTGAGMGGFVIALVDPGRVETVQGSLRDAGAAQVIRARVGSTS